MWGYDRLTKKDAPTLTEEEYEEEEASLEAYFDIDRSGTNGFIHVHTSALPTILYHYEDMLAEESESSSKGRHAPSQQAGLSEMLCVIGRLLLRKVLTCYQSSLEEEHIQQLLVRLLLSHFHAQTLERQAQLAADSLIEEDSKTAATATSKKKLKKDRKAKRAEGAEQGTDDSSHILWNEEQELQLLKQMGWDRYCPACEAATSTKGESVENGAGASQGSVASKADAARQLALEPLDPTDPSTLQMLELSEEVKREWMRLLSQKAQMLEERDRARAQVKQRFEDFVANNRAAVAW